MEAIIATNAQFQIGDSLYGRPVNICEDDLTITVSFVNPYEYPIGTHIGDDFVHRRTFIKSKLNADQLALLRGCMDRYKEWTGGCYKEDYRSSGRIYRDNADQIIAECIDDDRMTLVSFTEDDTSVYLNINDCSGPSLEGEDNRTTIVFKKAILSDDQLDRIRSLDSLRHEEQNRVALKMINQPGSHKYEYPSSITIWNRVPGSKKMTSRTFNKDYLNEETLKILRDHT